MEFALNTEELKSESPLVSIIVITYNSSKYVLETLESAKDQTYQNIELIISDDCSMDDTVEKCSIWIEKHKERFVRTELITATINKGIPTNCNQGAKRAHGEWLKFIAGDDILLKNCISDNLHFVNKHNTANIVTSDLEYIDSNGYSINYKSDLYVNFRKYYFSLNASKQLKTYSRLPIFLNTPAFFIKKNALVEVNYFDEEFMIYEDMCLIYKFNEKGWRIYYFDRKSVKYRISEIAISRQKNKVIENIREIEQKRFFLKYRSKNLSYSNIIDLSVLYEVWLKYYYKGILGYKGLSMLTIFSLHYWYVKYLNMRAI